MAIDKNAYFRRAGHVVLSDNGRLYDDYRGLDFRFDVTMVNNSACGDVVQGTVGILGLSAESVKAWSSFGLMSEALKKNRKVIVYAGYGESGDKTPLFSLPVVGATPTPPPDMWLNFALWNGQAFRDEVVTASLSAKPSKNRKRVTIRELCQFYCDWNKWKLVWNVPTIAENSLPVLNGLYVTQSKTDFLNMVNEIGPVSAFLSYRSPSALQRWLAGRETEYRLVVNYIGTSVDELVAAGERSLKSRAKEISIDTGLVGLPRYEIGANAMTLRTLLRSDVAVRDVVRFKSETIPSVNGYYQVVKVRLFGEFRGRDWYTEMKLIKVR